MATTKLLNDVLKREGNNFDLFRLIAAMAVIIGHAYALHPQPPLQDGVLSILHFDYSGSLAVKFFFFLSGMLVTNSIINNPNPFQFLAKRALRIFPGLLVCLLVAVLIVGPIFTKYSLVNYFSDPATWSYIKKNFLLMDLQWRLTGVFMESSNGLNGSLWTLPFEALCYIYLAIFYGLGLLKNKHIANAFFVGIVAVSLFAPTYFPEPFSHITESHLLPACFAIGALFANNKKHIPISITYAFLLCLLAYMLSNSNAFQFLLYIAFFYGVIFISSLPFVIKHFKLPFDASYGIYVYGYMIQQCVHVMFPNVSVHAHQFISLAIAIPIGILSWYYVERPCIELGHRLSGSISRQALKESINDTIKRIKIYSQKHYQLLIMIAIAVPIIICVYWFHLRTTEIYGDDLHQYLKHEMANGILTKINLPLAYDKLRPMQGLVSHLIIVLFKKHLTAYFLFNVGIQALNALIFAMLLNLFLRSPYVSIFISLMLGLSRFALFNITQALNGGALEGLAMTFFLLSLFFIVKTIIKQELSASQKQKGIIWAIVFANFGMYTHERYIVMLPFILLLIYVFPGLKTLTKKQKISLSLLVVISIILNVVIKKYVYSIPFFMGTSGVRISISFSSIFTHLTDAFLSILQVNHGPEYLTGIQFQTLSFKNQLPVILLLLGLLSVLILFIKKVYNAFILKQKDIIAIFYIFLALSVLFFMILLPAIITIRLEQRWLQGSASIFLLMAVIAWSTIPFKKTYVRYASCALFTLLFIRTDYIYLKEGVQHIYLTTAKNISSSFKRALDNGIIADSISKLYIWEKNKDQDFETAINWTLQEGYFFDFYQNKGKEIVFIMPSNGPISNFDSTTSRVLYYNNEVSDITAEFMKDQANNFDRSKAVNQLITFNDLDNFSTTGFYNNEGSFRWTNGNASIGFQNGNYNLKDSLNIELKTLMTPACKNVTPKILIKDEFNQVYQPIGSNRDGDTFFYKFYFNRPVRLQKIDISSETIDVAPPDVRVLSFPFISLQIKS